MEDTEGKITPRISMSVIVLVSTLFLGGVLFVIGYIVSRLSRSNKPSDSIKSKHCHKEILLAIFPLRLLAEKNHACVFANHSRRQVRFSFLFAFSLADRDKKEISFILADKDKGKYQKGNAFQTTNSILIDRSLNFPVTFLLLELTFRPFSAVLVLSSYYCMLLIKSSVESNY